jgi:hypothetical protein
VNLCGSGTAATRYTCDPGCDPTSGTCRSGNNGVAKYTCVGKWNQCVESELGWSGREELGNPGCNRTVQISLFDKKCRREDGGWDPTCTLLGYMVWYSGECGTAPRLSPTVTKLPSPTTEPIATGAPTPTTISKFVAVAPKVCGVRCGSDTDCQAGLKCFSGVCRNPACPSDGACFCGQTKGAAVANSSPKTGVSTWVGAVGMVGLALMGYKLIRWSRQIWTD